MTAPVDVVIAASNLAATSAFLGVLDFTEVTGGSLSGDTAASLLGREAATSWVRLAPAAASDPTRGGIVLVATAASRPSRAVTDCGPLAVDVYTRDIDASVARLEAAGHACGPVGTLDLGALVMRQVEVFAPDGWRLVLVEANVRRPSLLDEVDDTLHSEVHSVLWTVPAIADAVDPLQELGLTQTHVFPIRHPELARIISLPAPDTELTMNLMVDQDEAPIRVELCQFSEHPSAPLPDGPVHAGVWALASVPVESWSTTTCAASGVRLIS